MKISELRGNFKKKRIELRTQIEVLKGQLKEGKDELKAEFIGYTKEAFESRAEDRAKRRGKRNDRITERAKKLADIELEIKMRQDQLAYGVGDKNLLQKEIKQFQNKKKILTKKQFFQRSLDWLRAKRDRLEEAVDKKVCKSLKIPFIKTKEGISEKGELKRLREEREGVRAVKLNELEQERLRQLEESKKQQQQQQQQSQQPQPQVQAQQYQIQPQQQYLSLLQQQYDLRMSELAQNMQNHSQLNPNEYRKFLTEQANIMARYTNQMIDYAKRNTSPQLGSYEKAEFEMALGSGALNLQKGFEDRVTQLANQQVDMYSKQRPQPQVPPPNVEQPKPKQEQSSANENNKQQPKPEQPQQQSNWKKGDKSIYVTNIDNVEKMYDKHYLSSQSEKFKPEYSYSCNTKKEDNVKTVEITLPKDEVEKFNERLQERSNAKVITIGNNRQPLDKFQQEQKTQRNPANS